jgi:hypothetical protein
MTETHRIATLVPLAVGEVAVRSLKRNGFSQIAETISPLQ